MTEESIIKELAMFIDDRKYPFQLPRCFIYAWESDYWVLDSNGNTKEFEIKISKQDYLKDRLKDKHKECNGANYFYYVCPAWLILKDEVDNKYGLIYIHPTERMTIEKKPKRLNNNKFDQWHMLANKMYWKWYTLWREKWINKEISRDEYKAGFNICLDEHEKIIANDNLLP